MNLPNCNLSLEYSPIEEWKMWVRSLSNAQLPSVVATTNQLALKSDLSALPTLREIAKFCAEEMAKRFTGLLTLLNDAQTKLAKEQQTIGSLIHELRRCLPTVEGALGGAMMKSKTNLDWKSVADTYAAQAEGIRSAIHAAQGAIA